MRQYRLSRRLVLGCGLAIFAWTTIGAAKAANVGSIKVHRDPNCGCCGAWVDHLRGAGFTAEVLETSAINRVKSKLGVPQSLASCHTAEIDGYVIEGHVPAAAIRRLLAERPAGTGLAVPGMPIGSPGMEVEGSPPEIYSVILFGPSGQRVFGQYRGATEI